MVTIHDNNHLICYFAIFNQIIFLRLMNLHNSFWHVVISMTGLIFYHVSVATTFNDGIKNWWRRQIFVSSWIGLCTKEKRHVRGLWILPILWRQANNLHSDNAKNDMMSLLNLCKKLTSCQKRSLNSAIYKRILSVSQSGV